MILELYQAIAPGIPVAALFVAVISLVVSLRNSTNQQQARLLEKKTELISTIAHRRSKLGHLTMVCAQKLILLKSTLGADTEPSERQRLESNLELALEAQSKADKLIADLENTQPTDLIVFERMLATANQFLTHVTVELEKEQGELKDLQNSLRGR